MQEEDELITLSFQITTIFVDNIDFQEDIVDGKQTLHATMSVAYQERLGNDAFQVISISQGSNENTLVSTEKESRLMEYLVQKVLHNFWDQTVFVARNDKVGALMSTWEVVVLVEN